LSSTRGTSFPPLRTSARSELVLGAGYIGAKVAELALERGADVMLVDNWYATGREQLSALEERGARVETADIRRGEDVRSLLRRRWDRVYLLAAQASRPLSFEEPDYTEETNVTGARLVAERVDAPLVHGSSLHVYGPDLEGDVDASHPYGEQGDLSHLSKVYAEQCLRLYSRRRGFPVAILRLGIVYGPSPVEHDRPESLTVVDRFRRLARRGEPLPVDDPDATIGVVHVADAARILLDSRPDTVENVAAETVTVGDVAALARGEPAPGGARCRYLSPFEYRHRLVDYLEP
jgi:nucleoside-diphosphate-sugar epimerase